MAGQDLNLELIIKAKADQARAEIAATNASVKSMQTEAAAASSKWGQNIAADAAAWSAAKRTEAVASEAAAASTEKLAKSVEDVSRVSPLALNEVRALFDEISSGRTYRSPGTLAIIAQKVLGIGVAGLAAIGGVVAVTGAIAYLVYESIEASIHLRDLDTAFRLTGRGSEFTSENISYLLDFLGKLPGSTSEAASKFVDLISKMGGVDGLIANQVGQLLPALIETYGEKAPEAAAKLAETLSDLTENGFRKLDRELLNLSPAQYEQIQHLIETGNTAEATKRILQQLAQQSGVFVKSLGDQVYDTEQKISGLKNQLDELMASPFFLERDGSGTVLMGINRQIEEAQKHLTSLRQQESVQGKQSGDRQYKNQIDDANRLNQSLDEQGKLTAEIAQYQRDLNDARNRGDAAGIATFSTAIENLQKKLANMGKHGSGGGHENYMQAQRDQLALLEEDEQISDDKRLQFELDFWKKKLATLSAGSRQYAEVLRTTQALQRQIDKQQTQQAKQDLEAQLQATVTTAREQVSQKTSILQQQVQLGRISSQQEIAQEKDLQNQLYMIELKALQDRLKLEDLRPAERKRINDQIENLEKQHQLKMQALSNKGALDEQQAWEKALQPISQAFDQTIKGMIQGTQTLKQGLGNILDSIVMEFIDAEIKTLVHHVATEAAKTASTAASAAERTAIETTAKSQSLAMSAAMGLKEILNDAWQAASAAFKATAAIPVIGPVLAPAAGAAAFAAVAAMGGNIASAAGGYWELPGDQMIMAHEREMVIPARYAEGLRDLIEGGRRPAQGPSHTSITAIDAESFVRFARRNPSAFAAGMKKAVRNGAFR